MTVTETIKNGTYAYESAVSKADTKQEPFTMSNTAEDAVVWDKGEEQRQPDEVQEQFTGMSFMDLMNSGKGRKIPVVNQIVSSRNPEDGKIYRAYFTDHNIICNDADGRKAWELDVENEGQAEKVKDFFARYQPSNPLIKEIYSGDNMGMAVSKNFWLELFADSL